ncbi:Uncharacterised protein [Psychrobacter phenylpyruvicus]|uniref:Uncharacterized protein n=1 Tax=Psychrobacter phenylpyruvicus TaxID=29432 RepID=A0A379LGZ5_9GAMM|nr:Uncharacterised protein [Psychrobacter phenylpyruvicus]
MSRISDKLDKVNSLIDRSEFLPAFNLLNEIIIDNQAIKRT